MIVVVLNGWGASSRKPGGRAAAVVRSVLGWQAANARRYLKRNRDAGQAALIVGKSLGGWRAVVDVANRLKLPDLFCAVGLVTIDPCHPTLRDWSPNRNADTLHLHSGAVTHAVNVYAKQPPRVIAGARVAGAANIELGDTDHFKITKHPVVREQIKGMAARLFAAESERR